MANPQPYQARVSKFPDITVYGNGTYWGSNLADMCRSWGRGLGQDVEMRALFPDGSNEVYGIVTRSTALLIARCGPGANLDKAPCSSTLEWRNQRILCGGGLTDPSCQGELWFSLGVVMSVEKRTSNHRPDPQDWGIFKIARLGEQSDTVLLP